MILAEKTINIYPVDIKETLTYKLVIIYNASDGYKYSQTFIADNLESLKLNVIFLCVYRDLYEQFNSGKNTDELFVIINNELSQYSIKEPNNAYVGFMLFKDTLYKALDTGKILSIDSYKLEIKTIINEVYEAEFIGGKGEYR